MAVSYTHLDVYKRQSCDSPLGLLYKATQTISEHSYFLPGFGVLRQSCCALASLALTPEAGLPDISVSRAPATSRVTALAAFVWVQIWVRYRLFSQAIVAQLVQKSAVA